MGPRGVMPPAFRLASADDPSFGRFAAGLGDDGALAFGAIVLVKINDDPVGLPPELASPRGDRIERSEIPAIAHGMEQRQPSLAFRVEPLWGNLDQLPGARLLAIFRVDIQQQIDRGFLITDKGKAAHPREHLGKSSAHHGGTAVAKATDLLQPPVMSSGFERLASALLGDGAEIVVQGANRIGGSAVGGDAERVGFLHRENVGGLTKLVGDLIVRSGEMVLALHGDRAGLRPEGARPVVWCRLIGREGHFSFSDGSLEPALRWINPRRSWVGYCCAACRRKQSMQLPLQITFRHMDTSDAVAARIRERAEELERFFD